jgi:3D (Asp-Asp-Asp) domain-containing protein
LAVAVFLATVALVPAAGRSDPGSTAAALRAENDRIAGEVRSSVLELYSLDSQLTAARSRLDALHARAAQLRAERAKLAVELAIARRATSASEGRLAARIRQLYEQGAVSPIEVILGAQSLGDALTQLDDVDRVASVNADVITAVHVARRQLARASTALAARSAELRSALAAAAASEASLERTRAARESYLAGLVSQRDLNTAQIGRLEAQASAAQARAEALTVHVASSSSLSLAPAPVLSSTSAPGGMLTVTATGYALSGRTATGVPVGWGVAAVDPSVIPLGTHISVPGYGEAVAADVGGSIVGDRVDLWFPTVAQAHTWGLRTVTIALH